MNLMEEILVYLASLNIGVIGQTLFRSRMPSDVQEGTLLINLMPLEISPDAKKYCYGSLQIVCRSANEDVAVNKANSIINAIGEGQINLPNFKILKFKANHLPLPYPKSPGGLIEASVNFDINFVIK